MLLVCVFELVFYLKNNSVAAAVDGCQFFYEIFLQEVSINPVAFPLKSVPNSFSM